MKFDIFPDSDNPGLLALSFYAAIKSYYYGLNELDKDQEPIKKLFEFLDDKLSKDLKESKFTCESNWPEELVKIDIRLDNLHPVMQKFWYCIFGVVVDSSYLGNNYRAFAEKFYFRNLSHTVRELDDSLLIFDDCKSEQEEIEFIQNLTQPNQKN